MIQRVVRTYPWGYLNNNKTTEDLEQVLEEGCHVIMCNPIRDHVGSNAVIFNEYIVQKD